MSSGKRYRKKNDNGDNISAGFGFAHNGSAFRAFIIDHVFLFLESLSLRAPESTSRLKDTKTLRKRIKSIG
jgi:hypothetical protein